MGSREPDHVESVESEYDSGDESAEPRRIAGDAAAHFQSAWTKTWIEDPAYEIHDWLNPQTAPGGTNRFFHLTLNTPTTMPHYLVLLRKELPEWDGNETLPTQPSTTNTLRRPTAVSRPPDLVTLHQLGSPGVDGWPGVTHGGFNCAVLDGTMGSCINAVRDSSKFDQGGALFTANLNISFFSPVRTGRDIVIKCWVTGRTRTKFMTMAQISGQNGEVLCQGDALFVVTQNPKF